MKEQRGENGNIKNFCTEFLYSSGKRDKHMNRFLEAEEPTSVSMNDSNDT